MLYSEGRLIHVLFDNVINLSKAHLSFLNFDRYGVDLDIVIIQIMWSVSLCPKVITESEGEMTQNVTQGEGEGGSTKFRKSVTYLNGPFSWSQSDHIKWLSVYSQTCPNGHLWIMATCKQRPVCSLNSQPEAYLPLIFFI